MAGKNKGEILPSTMYGSFLTELVSMFHASQHHAYFSILRLSIARAIYQNFAILVLDEATSALDSRSELLLKEALMNLMANHTVSGVCSRSIVLHRFLCLPVFMIFSPHFQVVIIAHRLEMILMADRIVLLEGGKLREITRSAFLSLDGRFGSPPDVLSRELGEA